MKLFAALAFSALVAAGAQAAPVNFSDDFNSGPSAAWGNQTGGWTTSNGTYLPSAPNNAPFAASLLPYELTDFTFTVDVVALADGGIFLRSDAARQNGVLLVLGGGGYGQGVRNGTAGTELYFHIIDNGTISSPVGQINGLFTPGSDYRVKVDVSGISYAVYVNDTLIETLVNNQFASGFVGLYDDQPNTTTANGFGTPTAFDNVQLVGQDTSVVPEPASWAMMVMGFGLAGGALRRGRARIAFA